uniref:Uncharacterized protein n=1 Tax=Pipistrellus kuhlii TaxID=59472 RepID=A0A7J7XVC0_PIPKU|nr:hypothetical protein mPipKuh1_010493 [Pipistrellus kuhlii]
MAPAGTCTPIGGVASLQLLVPKSRLASPSSRDLHPDQGHACLKTTGVPSSGQPCHPAGTGTLIGAVASLQTTGTPSPGQPCPSVRNCTLNWEGGGGGGQPANHWCPKPCPLVESALRELAIGQLAVSGLTARNPIHLRPQPIVIVYLLMNLYITFI